METRVQNYLYTVLLVMFAIIFNDSFANGQVKEKELGDTIKAEENILKISEIAIRSGEIAIETNESYKTFIKPDLIKEFGRSIDSLDILLDSLLIINENVDLSTLDPRYLLTKLSSWQKHAARIERDKNLMVAKIEKLENAKFKLEQSVQLLENTLEYLEKRDIETTIMDRIDRLSIQIDTVLHIAGTKSNEMLVMLDKLTRKSLLINERIEAIDEALLTKKYEYFSRNQPSVFSLNFSDRDNWNLKKSLRLFYQMEVVELVVYLKDNITKLIFQMILLIILIFSFTYAKKWLRKTSFDSSSVYTRMLTQILSRSVSAALIPGLFASVIIFNNRPELFKDLMRLLVTIPLVIITINIVSRKYHKYVYLFALIIYLQQFAFILPDSSLIFRITIIVIAIIETAVLIHQAIEHYKHPIRFEWFNSVIKFILILFAGFAFLGLISALVGSTMLAELLINIPVSNLFVAVLVAITIIILSGLVEIELDRILHNKLKVVHDHGEYIKKKLIQILIFGGSLLWLGNMLKTIHVYRDVYDGLKAFFTAVISMGSISFTPGNIFLFFFILWLANIISKMIRILLEKDVLSKMELSKGVPHTIASMFRYSIIAIGFILAIGALGIPVDSLVILFGALGVGIGFGLQNIFNDIISGFILLFERPIQIDDTIEVGELIGEVKSIGIRSSNMKTWSGAEVIVPNGQLVSSEVVNWTLSDQKRRLEAVIQVSYDSDPHQVKDVLMNVLTDHPDVLKNPGARVLFTDLGESSLDFKMYFWTSRFNENLRIRSEVIFNVFDKLKEAGIEIPFPQRVVHLKPGENGIDMEKKPEK